MKFNILKAYVSYGGSLGGLPEFKIDAKNVTADYVQGYFKDKPNLTKDYQGFSTHPDSMGCYIIYKVEVSDLGVKPHE